MAGGYRGIRKWLAAGLAFLAAGIVPAADASTAHAASAPKISTGMLIRLHDLRHGFVVDDEIFCGRFSTEGADEPLSNFIYRYRPRGCEAAYARLYRAPGTKPNPRVATSVVVDARSAAGVRAAERVAPELLERLTGNVAVREVKKQRKVWGHAARLFHVRHGGAFGLPRRESLLLWRYRNLLGIVIVGGPGFIATDRTANRLARRQQKRMRHPTPYPRSQQDDLLVPLDNPRLRFPVYWLGRTFRPGHGLPPTRLYAASPLDPGGGPPKSRLLLAYDLAIRLTSWTRAGWQRYSATELGRMVLSWHCTRTHEIERRDGYAILYAGYTTDAAVCPEREPDIHLAVVHLGRTVVGVNLPICLDPLCVEPSIGPYGTEEGMEAIVRGLRLRPKRDYQPDY